MLAIVPVKTMVVLFVPVPVVKVNPVVWAKLMVPFVTVRVTFSGLDPASTSLMLMALPLLEENMIEVSSLMVCALGTELIGASLTALTVIATVLVSLRAPPDPVLPWSLVVMVRVSLPL